MEANNLESNGWVVKAPYTTNHHYVKYSKDLPGTVQCLKRAAKRFFGTISYMLVQPRLNNVREDRVVCLDGKAMHIAHIGCARGKAFGCMNDLFVFAENSIKLLRRECSHSITDNLVRVDIMVTKDGRFVVNEFESLEANFSGKSVEEEAKIKTFLISYWYKKIKKYIEKIKLNF